LKNPNRPSPTHMSPQYGKLWPITLRSVGKFGAARQTSTGFTPCLCYCSDVAQQRPTELCTMFGTIYTFSGALAPSAEFCHVQNSLCVQVLHSPILAALLHGTQAVGIRRNGITELSQRAPPIFGWAAITLGSCVTRMCGLWADAQRDVHPAKYR